MRLVQQVQSVDINSIMSSNEEGDVLDLDSSKEIYDDVRGVTSAPLRESVGDPLQDVDTQQAQQVWETLLQPKTRRQGGQQYFCIKTKES